MLTSKKGNKKYISVFFLIIACGIFLRFYNLGNFGFWTDEIYHVIGAKSIIETGRPIFPSGDEYTRALPFTRLVALSFKIFGVSEFSARLPSVLINIVFLFVSFFIVKNWFNTYTALLFLLVMAFSPFTLWVTRQCRFYTIFQLFYFLGMMFFFYGLEWEEKRDISKRINLIRKIERKYQINFFLLFISLVFIYLAYIFHTLTINCFISISVYIIIMMIIQIKSVGFVEAIKSKYSITLSTMVIIFIVFWGFDNFKFLSLLNLVSSVPHWHGHRIMDINTYRYFLFENYSGFVFIYPLSVIFCIKHNLKKGLYLFSTFAPLLFAHSFFYSWKELRYIFYIFPFFIFSVTPVVIYCCNVMWEYMKHHLDCKSPYCKTASLAAALIATYIFFYPWFMNSKNEIRQWRWSDWKQIAKSQKIDIMSEKDCFITTSQNLFYYYFGKKPDYYLAVSYDREKRDGEYLSGARTISSMKKLTEIFGKKNNVIIITNNFAFNSPAYFSNELRNYVLNNTREIIIENSKLRIFEKRNNSKDVELNKSADNILN